MQRRYLQRSFPVNNVGLALYYKLGAGLMSTGKVFDYSQNGNTGVVTGTSIVPAYPGFRLAGNNEYFDVGSPLQNTFRGSFTLAVWVKLNDGQTPDQQVAMGLRDTSGAESRVDLTCEETGDVMFRFGANNQLGTKAQTLNMVLPNGQTEWIHIAGVLDATIEGAGGKVIYINGKLAALDGAFDGNTTNVISAAFTAATNIYVGGININNVLVGPLAGLIDEPMIFNVAKTAEEMMSLYMRSRHLYRV